MVKPKHKSKSKSLKSKGKEKAKARKSRSPASSPEATSSSTSKTLSALVGDIFGPPNSFVKLQQQGQSSSSKPAASKGDARKEVLRGLKRKRATSSDADASDSAPGAPDDDDSDDDDDDEGGSSGVTSDDEEVSTGTPSAPPSPVKAAKVPSKSNKGKSKARALSPSASASTKSTSKGKSKIPQERLLKFKNLVVLPVNPQTEGGQGVLPIPDKVQIGRLRGAGLVADAPSGKQCLSVPESADHATLTKHFRKLVPRAFEHIKPSSDWKLLHAAGRRVGDCGADEPTANNIATAWTRGVKVDDKTVYIVPKKSFPAGAIKSLGLADLVQQLRKRQSRGRAAREESSDSEAEDEDETDVAGTDGDSEVGDMPTPPRKRQRTSESSQSPEAPSLFRSASPTAEPSSSRLLRSAAPDEASLDVLNPWSNPAAYSI